MNYFDMYVKDPFKFVVLIAQMKIYELTDF